MALIGNGSQAIPGAGFVTQLGISEIRVFDIDPKATDKLLTNLAPFTGTLGSRSCERPPSATPCATW